MGGRVKRRSHVFPSYCGGNEQLESPQRSVAAPTSGTPEIVGRAGCTMLKIRAWKGGRKREI
jgi:hypothetical protein